MGYIRAGRAELSRRLLNHKNMAKETPMADDGDAAAAPQRRINDASARDHLANERTFLAWVRTGIALVGFGILIAKLRYAAVEDGASAAAMITSDGLIRRSALLGAAFTILGIGCLLLGVFRYATGERAILRGETLTPRPAQLYALTALLVLLGLAVLLYLTDLWHPG